MITSGQLRAARALLSMDRQTLAAEAGLSLPTIQRMESAKHVVGGNVESLVKVIGALQRAGIELIAENAPSQALGRGVRLNEPKTNSTE